MKNLIKLALLLVGLCATSAIVRAQDFPSLNSIAGVSSIDEAAAVAASQANNATIEAQRQEDELVAELTLALAIVRVILDEYCDGAGEAIFDHIEFEPQGLGNMADIYDYPDYDDHGGWASGCC